MSITLVTILLVLDAILIEIARRRSLRTLSDANLFYGIFITGSALVFMANLLAPTPGTFYTALGWLFVTSLPAVWISASPNPRARALARDKSVVSFEDAPLHVVPSAEEVKNLRQSGIETKDLLCMVLADLDSEGNYQKSLLGLTKTCIFHLDIEGKVTAAKIDGLRKVKALVFTGGGQLEVTDSSENTSIWIRYSNTCARPIGTLAKRLNNYLESREKLIEYEGKKARNELSSDDELPDPPNLEISDEDEEDWRCPTCGMHLQESATVCPRCLNKGKSLLRIIRLAKPYWIKMSVIIGLMLFGTGLSLIQPYLTKLLFDDVLLAGVIDGEKRINLLIWIVAALGAIYIFGALNESLSGRLNTTLGAMVTRDLRAKAFNHLETLSLGYFNKQKVGGLMSRLDNDTGMVEELLVSGLRMVLINGLLVLGIAGALVAMNWRLGLLALLPAPMLISLSFWFWRHVRGRYQRYWDRVSRMSAFLNDSLGGIRVVKAFGKENQEVERFAGRNSDLYHAGVRADIMWATYKPGLNLIMNASSILVWYYGGTQVLNQEITPGTFVAYLGYMSMFYGPLMALTQINNFLTRSLTAAERVFEILDVQPDVKDFPEAIEMPAIEGRIEMTKVTFGYDPLYPVLKNFTLRAEPGEMIGLVGHSGAGKSTTINLICRLYDIQDGSIKIDGMDIKKVTQESLRKQVGTVLQETFLFSGSIAENIGYANLKASREDIIRAAMAANAHEFIMQKPESYDTPVGERGVTLSGGEKQRIAIARAILHNPRILILDEATSSVDTQTEQKIQKAMERLVKNRTTIAIAHRLSTLRRADRLIVLDNGEVVEQGSHEELMKKDGVYAKLVNTQAEMAQVMTLTD